MPPTAKVGLGAVDPPVQTGQPAPLSPLSRALEPPRCILWVSNWGSSQTEVDLEVLYAGLAPSMIGIYQLTVRIPSPLPIPPSLKFWFIRCSKPGLDPSVHNDGSGFWLLQGE
ncbi:MAG: hypothetical protein IT168_15400 [Bryobacterales bacterium]|nr:hypothetical protein [Bryobacterales bacterium]